jgi:hypothetical protein
MQSPVKKRDEKLWRLAKRSATGSGRADDHAYILEVYRRMVHEAKYNGGDEPVKKAHGGPYIGPRGGKWADPKHTKPWKPGAQLDMFSSKVQRKAEARGQTDLFAQSESPAYVRLFRDFMAAQKDGSTRSKEGLREAQKRLNVVELSIKSHWRQALAAGKQAVAARYEDLAKQYGIRLEDYFPSGSNHAGEIRGFTDAGMGVGVSAKHVDAAAVRELEALAGTGKKVFVDSGAFEEIKFNAPRKNTRRKKGKKKGTLPRPDLPEGSLFLPRPDLPEGVPFDVKPMTPEIWDRVLGLYDRLTDSLGTQAYIVAPDKVADQGVTLERLTRYAERVKGARDKGANVIVAIQKGAGAPVQRRKLVLVSCGSEKKHPEGAQVPAEELYTSDFFQKKRQWAEEHGEGWAILSAKHGVIDPSHTLTPYDVKLGDHDKAERAAWADRVTADVLTRVSPGDTVVMLAGGDYRKGVVDALEAAGIKVENPVQGLGIGDQKAKLAEMTRSARQAPLSMADFDRACSKALGYDDYIRGLPLKKGATTVDDVRQFLRERQPARVHLLGLGTLSENYDAIQRAINAESPHTVVTLDSVRITALVGRGDNPRPLTVAFDEVTGDLDDAAIAFADTPAGHMDPSDYTDAIAEPETWLTPAGKKGVLSELRKLPEFDSTQQTAARADLDEWLQGPVHEDDPDGRLWYEHPTVEGVLDSAWKAHYLGNITAERKRRAIKMLTPAQRGDVQKGLMGTVVGRGLFAKAVKGARKAGAKYTRRVPKPGGGFRYYYAESSAAREATEGEDVKLGKHHVKVKKVDSSGRIHVEHSKHGALSYSHEEWQAEMVKHHGDRYLSWIDKRARQSAGAILRHVPRELLEELKGATDKERLAELRKKSPEIYKKLEAAFKRAGVSPYHAKDLISGLLKRQGWNAEARAAMIGNVTSGDGASKIRKWRMMARAAENLAGGSEVGAAHVEGAWDLAKRRLSNAKGYRDGANKAAAELATLKTALAAAASDPSKAHDVLNSLLKSPQLAEFAALLKAFPGIGDDARQDVQDTLAQTAAVTHQEPTRHGAETDVFYGGEDGEIAVLKGRFVLMEAEEVKPSHDPTTWRKTEGYPDGWQTRVYHTSKDEQQKVEDQVSGLHAALHINTNPDATNGAPIITPEGHVLGGNSRTMAQQLAYKRGGDASTKLRAELEKKAAHFGLRAEDVQAMKNPILVRVVDPPAHVKDDQQKMMGLVHKFNESFTQGMDPLAAAVAQGAKIDKKVLASLGGMPADETLASFLRKSDSKPLMASLRKAGVFTKRNANTYLDKAGIPNEAGRQLVEQALVGHFIGDISVMAQMTSGQRSAMARAVPYLLAAEGHGEEYSLRESMKTAIDGAARIRAQARALNIGNEITADKKKFDAAMHAVRGDRGGDAEGNYVKGADGKVVGHAMFNDPRAEVLAEVLIRRGGVKQFPDAVRAWADAAKEHKQGQRAASMPGIGGGGGDSVDAVFHRSVDPNHAEKKASKERERAEAAGFKIPEPKKKKGDEGPQKGLFGAAVEKQAAAAKPAKTTYGAIHRPPTSAAVPKGGKTGEHEDFRHGTVTYAKPLDSAEAKRLGLVEIPSDARKEAVIGAVADDLREYANAHLEMHGSDSSYIEGEVRNRLRDHNVHGIDHAEAAKKVVAELRKEVNKHQVGLF